MCQIKYHCYIKSVEIVVYSLSPFSPFRLIISFYANVLSNTKTDKFSIIENVYTCCPNHPERKLSAILRNRPISNNSTPVTLPAV